MSEGFQKNIQNWVSVDNKIKSLQNQVKELRSQRTDLTSSIFRRCATFLIIPST